MNRIALSDGRWFDPERATCWDEDTDFDGSNRISCATGDQFEHEKLYRTAQGGWVLNHWSQWQGRGETYKAIEPGDAVLWLIRNHHPLPRDLEAFAEDLEA